MQKAVIYLTLLIEVLGISIIIPAFPELREFYGVGDFAITVALAIYSLFSFLAAPLMGQRSDKVGRKKSLIWCIVGTTLSYFILLWQPRYLIFIISRIINGITGGNVSIIQAILTDISPDQESRNKNFGLMGAMFGLGFIIGPLVGSLLLSLGGITSIFWGGGMLALLQLIALFLFFTNTNTVVQHKRLQFNPFITLQKYISRPSLKPWLLSFIFLGIAGFVLNSSQSLYMATEFGTSGIRYGYFLATVGLFSAINMAVFVPRFWTTYFSTRQLLILYYSSMSLGFLALGFITDELTYMISIFVFLLLYGSYSIVYNVHIMGQAQKGETGEISGMFGSVQSLAMIFGPLVGGALLETSINIHWGALLFVILAVIIMYPVLSSLPTGQQGSI